jgi:hypothetical protein
MKSRNVVIDRKFHEKYTKTEQLMSRQALGVNNILLEMNQSEEG